MDRLVAAVAAGLSATNVLVPGNVVGGQRPPALPRWTTTRRA